MHTTLLCNTTLKLWFALIFRNVLVFRSQCFTFSATTVFICLSFLVSFFLFSFFGSHGWNKCSKWILWFNATPLALALRLKFSLRYVLVDAYIFHNIDNIFSQSFRRIYATKIRKVCNTDNKFTMEFFFFSWFVFFPPRFQRSVLDAGERSSEKEFYRKKWC